jgi:hypothetical protein
MNCDGQCGDVDDAGAEDLCERDRARRVVLLDAQSVILWEADSA